MTANEYRNPATVSIAGTDVRVVTYKGEPVVTFAMVDQIHKSPDGSAKRTFGDHRERFVEGEDFIEIGSDVIRTDLPEGVFSKFAPKGTLITRRGYLKLVKPMGDDRAWEVQGEMIDRYFMVEKIAALAPEVLEMIRRDDGISRMLAHKVTEMEKVIGALPALVDTVNTLVAIVQPSAPGVVIRHGKTAGTILKANGFSACPMRLALWFGNRLEAAGCRVEGRLDTGTSHARLFDPDKAEAWLKNGGKASVEKKMAERSGQGALALTGHRRVPALPTIPPEMDNEGIGAIMMKGVPVYFDTRVGKLEPNTPYVVINVKGDVVVDIPAASMAGIGGTMGPRGVLTSPRMEPVPGRADPIPVQWEGVILGKVLARDNVVRLPSAGA